jgi:RNA polymerase sigma-70 factor, ECF subfamily
MKAGPEHLPDITELLATDLDRHFQHLVLSFQQRLYTFVLRQTGSQQDTEDIVQETFIRAYHALADYPPERIRAMRFQSWLYKIALNIFYRHKISTHFQCLPLDLSDESEILAIEDDDREQPERVFEWLEDQHELESLLARLPEQHRVAISCYYFEDLSYREIAELLNQPVGTIKSNIHRGMQFLRKTLVARGDELLRPS